MKTLLIQVITAPDYICLDREHHIDLFLKAFVGIKLSAKEDPKNTTVYLVEIKEAIIAMMEQHGPISIEGVYWQMRWKNHSLHDFILLPQKCCQVIEDKQ